MVKFAFLANMVSLCDPAASVRRRRRRRRPHLGDDLCGRRFLSNGWAKCNEPWYINSRLSADDARPKIFPKKSFLQNWQRFKVGL